MNNKLDTVDITTICAKGSPYKLSDGGGLFLLVDTNGGRYWRLSYRYAGKQKTISLGVYPSVTLAEARSRREDAKLLLASGVDPSASRKAEKAIISEDQRKEKKINLTNKDMMLAEYIVDRVFAMIRDERDAF